MTNPSRSRRRRYVKLSFSETEYARVQDLAAQAGRKLATYCRLKALEQDEALTPWEPILRDLHREFGPIGNNLNQLTRHLNRGHQLEASLVQSLRETLNELRLLLYQVQQRLRP